MPLADCPLRSFSFNNTLTTLLCPRWAAHPNSVKPWLSDIPGLTSSSSTNGLAGFPHKTLPATATCHKNSNGLNIYWGVRVTSPGKAWCFCFFCLPRGEGFFLVSFCPFPAGGFSATQHLVQLFKLRESNQKNTNYYSIILQYTSEGVYNIDKHNSTPHSTCPWQDVHEHRGGGKSQIEVR